MGNEQAGVDDLRLFYMQKRTISYIGEVAFFSSALIPGALRPGLGQA